MCETESADVPPANEPSGFRFWTAKEVSEILGVSTDTIANFCNSGRISFLKCGRAFRFHPADVRNFIARNRFPARDLAAITEDGTSQITRDEFNV
jgi:excisionase family DNA binding protein